MVFETAKWIWSSKEYGADEYGEFFKKFNAKSCNNIFCRISCDGDYTLYVNGRYVASNQYGDYEHYKIYDEIDISHFTKIGENSLSVLVWHTGIETSRYKNALPGLIFEVFSGENTLASSNERTLTRKSPAYESGRCKLITGQLGFGFHYNANLDDGNLFTGVGFKNSVEINKTCTFYKRPIEKLHLGEGKTPICTKIDKDKRHFLFDFGEECVGLVHFELFSENPQKIRIDWGEDLQNGSVRRVIGNRTFSVEYTAKPGENDYTNYMLRFGCRYIEFWSESAIDLGSLKIIPEFYPVKEIPNSPQNTLDKEIYELCLNTLKLCMMEHYVDCPWREQALYAYDSRNQMLAGYYAFEGGNAEYARSNLKLISMDRREGGLLSICYPTGKALAIPSFSLHYVIAVYEYYENTGDTELLKEVYPKLLEIAENFVNRLKDGLIQNFSDSAHWNFYDWSKHLSGELGNEPSSNEDSISNMLFAIALEKLEKISEIIGKEFAYSGISKKTVRRVKEVFFDENDRLFSFTKANKDYTELANSLAVICGAADGELAAHICAALALGAVSESSLSMKCFTYDALIKTNPAYKDYVLSDIREKYGYMLRHGATAAWETIKGASDFDNAGSLCHGWSATPIYYYNKFNMV